MTLFRKIFTVAIAGIFVLLGEAAFGAEELSLQALIEEARENNPEIQALKKRYEAADARIWQAGSLADPVFEYEYDTMTPDRELSDNAMQTVGVSQEIPFPTKLFLRAKIASQLAKIASQAYQAKEREVFAQVKSAYEELLLIYRSIEITKENKGVLNQLSKVATSRYAANKISQADVLKAQVELAKIESELIILEQKRLVAQARLNVLLNRDPGKELGLPAGGGPIRLARSLDELYALAKDNNPELKAFQFGIEKGKAAFRLSQQEFLPDFQVSFRQMIRSSHTEDGMWAGMLGVTIPLWAHKKVFGVKEMKAELEMLEFEYRMKENMVLFDLQDAYARAEANIKLIELYETAFIPQAEQAFDAAMRGYEAEKTDFLSLLDNQRMLTEFKLGHYKAILGLRVALADIERVVGKDIDFK